jgi:pimeloyl-ACP methyl ester carboxylesterase
MPTPLVLLPGLLCDRAVWQAQIEALGPAQVVDYGALDSLTAMAQHALATAPPGRLRVAGHSMGGRVAFEMWRQAPERIERLALLDTSYHPLGEGAAGAAESAGRHSLLALAQRDGMRAMAGEWALGMLHPSRHGTPLFEAVLDMLERKTPDIFAAQINALLKRPDCSQLLATIRCPTLLLCGREDHWSPPARHEHMQRAIAGAHLVVVAQCGHMSTMEQPEAVNQALAEWLG